MADNLTQDQRSAAMRRVKSGDTAPEVAVRRLLREMGAKGYRLHRKDLPGKVDIAFVSRKLAIFVHGCFWHGHDCQRGARTPKSNELYWPAKIDRNRRRDKANIAALRANGWRVLVVWECEINRLDELRTKLAGFLGGFGGQACF